MGHLRIRVILLCLSVGIASPAAIWAERVEFEWRRGSYLGITPDLSDKRAVLGRFGPPDYSGPTANEDGAEALVDTEVLDYADLDGLRRTQFVIDLHSGKVKEIWVDPGEMSLADLDRRFREKYFVLGDIGCDSIGTVFVEPGSSYFRVYPGLGITVLVDGSGSVGEIAYSSHCNGAMRVLKKTR